MDKPIKELVRNRRASYDYELLESFEAGIVLYGGEIKSLRQGGGSLQEAYVKVFGFEVWLVSCSIAPYRFDTLEVREEKRERKLLLHKREIVKLSRALQERGLTVIPLSIYLKGSKAKVRIATAKGKRQFDKRSSMKEKEDKKRMARSLRGE